MSPNLQPINNDAKEYLFKVLVIGDLATGKTSYIKRYVHQYFSRFYKATIGVDFALKVINWDEHTIIRLQLWDIAGQERFGSMTRVYYKEAVGAFIMFDVSRQGTFEGVIKWKNDLDTKVSLPDGSPVPCLLIANKCDLSKEGDSANAAFLDRFCQENGFTGWYFVSPKENINVEESAQLLVSEIINKRKALMMEESGDNDIVSLYREASLVGRNNSCAC